MPLTDSERTIVRAVDERRESTVELLRELVRTDTVNPYSGDSPSLAESVAGPRGERVGQEIVERTLAGLGARTRMFEPPTDTYERAQVIGPRNRSWKDRPNAVAEWTFGDGGGPSVIILAHIDTVGVEGMPEPFSGAVRDGRIWGRGASDDKGGIVAGLAAVEALTSVAGELSGTVTFLSVVDEECNGSGAGIIACALDGIRADSAISLDGSAGEIVRGCQGCLTAEIVVPGQSGHAALGNGVNAVEKAMLIAQAILGWRDRREAEHPNRRVNLGIFHGGTLPAVIPGQARLSLNAVYGIEEARASQASAGRWGGDLVWAELEQAIREVEAADPWLRDHPCELVWVKDLVPYEEQPGAPVVAGMLDAACDVMDGEPDLTMMTAWTDSCWLSVLADTPVVSFGPARSDVVHGPGEYVEIDAVLTSAKAVALYVYRQLKRS